MFILIAITVFIALLTYIGWRLIIPAPIGRSLKMVAWLLVYLPVLLVPARILSMKVEQDLPGLETLISIIFVDIGFLSIVLALVLLRDSVGLLGKLWKKVHSWHRCDLSEPLENPQRRLVLSNSVNGGIILLAGSMSSVGMYNALRLPEVKEVPVRLNKLPKEFEGFRILQLTDLHINQLNHKKWLEAVVQKVNQCQPDLVALTGDLSDLPVGRVRHLVAPLADLSARYGCFFVTGNHEYLAGVGDWVNEVDKLGFSVLMNEHVVLRRNDSTLLVGGVADISGAEHHPTHESSPLTAISGGENSDCKILLAHQPQSIHQAEEVGFDLQISGHTHGGQFIPWKYLTDMVQPYLYGLHKHKGSQIYVSRGTGYWGPPMRLGAPSEITLITLHKV